MVSPNATNSKVSVSIEYTKSSVGLRTKEIFTHTHAHTKTLLKCNCNLKHTKFLIQLRKFCLDYSRKIISNVNATLKISS